MEAKKPLYFIDELKELCKLSHKLPTDDFSSSEFWKGLILSNAVPDCIRSMGSEKVAALWRQIMRRTNNDVKVVESMIKDYVSAKYKDASLSEKIENSLYQFLNSDINAQTTGDNFKLSAKRQTSEESTQKATCNANKCFKVLTKARFPKIDLSMLMSKSQCLTKCYDAIDKEEVSSLSKLSVDFAKIYTNLLSPDTSKALKEMKMNVKPEKDPSSIKIEIIRRDLKMLQECYEKTSEEMAEIYVKSSGNFDTMRNYLKGDPNTKLWEKDEDDILRKGSSSVDYKMLIKKKGKNEVNKRVEYLNTFYRAKL